MTEQLETQRDTKPLPSNKALEYGYLALNAGYFKDKYGIGMYLYFENGKKRGHLHIRL